MNYINYMSNSNRFKETVSIKKLLIHSDVTRNTLDDLKNSEIFCA